ncbi:HTH-type transcriptional regulator MhqR [Fundidesulfovibrio magnetotacticus]|uniref:HTH-type transcriptional regulator MhqR n=1 Tax=Fundidesulfovibrio magnetotacticus TaxID=2730080 RepID=A0A6V8LMA8_9BACT|nr:MarR family transcriptional regulator [Fundidesulfovibrio magnetotacticus]GFK93813.1 HTH-type transcriptional regulator MhqR [Fundidesulfovibrio magnetotacticus]
MILKDMPSYQTLLDRAQRYPTMDVLVCEAYLHVLRTGTILHHCVERGLAKRGLSFGRFMILNLLCREPDPIPVCKLAEMVGVTTPTVSAVLSGMVRDLLVERLEDPQDRRVVRIALLPAGQKVLDDVLPDLFRYQADVMSGLNGEEFKTLIALLSKVRLEADGFAACGAARP